VSWPVDAVRFAESKEFWETLDRGLATLSPQIAAAFTLREIDGLSAEEICDILGVTPNNLWVILHRGRARLRQFLEAEWFRGYHPHEPVINPQVKQRAMPLGRQQSGFTYRAAAA
jgi:DNA-directed RNA polymerase specialized sigma24 family protein